MDLDAILDDTAKDFLGSHNKSTTKDEDEKYFDIIIKFLLLKLYYYNYSVDVILIIILILFTFDNNLLQSQIGIFIIDIIFYYRDPEDVVNLIETEKRKCNGNNCSNDAFLICPTCTKIGLKDLSKSYFCTQECFKNNYKVHKNTMHQLDEDIARCKDMLVGSGLYSKEELKKVKTYDQLEKLQKDSLVKMQQQQQVNNNYTSN